MLDKTINGALLALSVRIIRGDEAALERTLKPDVPADLAYQRTAQTLDTMQGAELVRRGPEDGRRK